MRKNKGITLIALVITIIVLLILAAVSIATLTGENGVLTKAQEAKIKSEQGEVLEELRLQSNVAQVENTESNASVDMFSYLKDKNILTDKGILTEKLIKSGYYTGTGNEETGNYYQVRDGILYYITEEKEEVELGKVFNNIVKKEDEDTTDIFTYMDEEKTKISTRRNKRNVC